MASVLTYAEAVRLLGGSERAIAGVPKPGEDVTPTDVLSWFNESSELVGQSEALIRALVDRRTFLSGARRAESLAAAHTVIVASAFFASLTEVRLPVELTHGDELSTSQAAGLGDFAEQIRSAGELVPNPTRLPGSFEADLRRYYLGLADRLHRFIRGLAEWERLPVPQRNRITRQLTDTADHAIRRYQEAILRLAAVFPEAAVWSQAGEHLATADMPAVRIPGIWRESLARVYQADLRKPILGGGDGSDGVLIPTVQDSYVTPQFRLAETMQGARIIDDSWWADRPVRDDLQEFLAAYLTSPRAIRAPLLILGDPGAGKSLLTKVLAARLPANDFMTIRVPLREVPAEADVMEQIESAIRAVIGQRAEWPALVDAAMGALPVILLDGFDELLQATGLSQTDYLLRVAAFQRREATVGRPTAVIVTSRTAIADQARAPDEATALRLEPFDDSRVRRWLQVWNRTNTPLAPEIVLAQGDLVTQPLLLLLLALHLSSGGEMGVDLYETLLNAFIRREVRKFHAGLSEPDLRDSANNTTLSLSVAAFAMFNRNRRWATHMEIDSDLNALGFSGRRWPAPQVGLRWPLSPAELLMDQFFFVHRAQATPDDAPERSYEFLHATFGDFLLSHLTWDVLRSMSGRATADWVLNSPDDELLRSLLSYQPLSLRSSVPAFLAYKAAQDGQTHELLLELFRRADQPRQSTYRYGYEPVSLGVPARYATYAVNLLLLLLCTGSVQATDLYPRRPDPVEAWHSDTLLWRSQLSAEGWRSLVEAVTLERIRVGDRRDLRLTLGSGPVDPVIDPYPSGPDSDARWLRRESHFQCGYGSDAAHHALEPLTRQLPWALTTFTGTAGHELRSAARALVDVWADPSSEVYRTAIMAADPAQDGYLTYWELLLAQLTAGNGVTPGLAAEVLDAYLRGPGHSGLPTAVTDNVLRCVLTFLGRDAAADPRLAWAANAVITNAFDAADPVLVVDALVRLSEKGLPADLPPVLQDRDGRAALMLRVVAARPDLEARLQAVMGRR